MVGLYRCGRIILNNCINMLCNWIEKRLAYVDSFQQKKVRIYRGTLTEAGKESPDRSRSIANI